MQEGGSIIEESEQEKHQKRKNHDDKSVRLMNAKFKKFLDQMISTMEMPCYDKLKTFYYYDVLEALSRHLF